MTDITANAAGKARDTSFFGHPKGLAILFFTEMWERFSYYGMRGLLILYLTQHFLFSDERSAVMYGAYTALVYVMTIIGGTLADRYLGQRKAVTFGAILLCLGHFGMAFEGSGSKEYLAFDGQETEISDSGRGSNRKLFLEYDGENRRLVFDSVTFVDVNGQRLLPVNDDGEGDYVIQEVRRGLVQNLCGLVGAGCAGPEPRTDFVWNGETYPVTATDDGKQVEIGGQAYPIVTQTNIHVLETATAEKDTAGVPVIREVLDGSYETRIEQQQFFVMILFLSLALIIAGVGYLKANISTIVGALYEFDDPRRDSGFTLFYMGINLGSFLSSITCGILGIVYGWAWGFGLAGIGMAAGLAVFIWGQKYLDGKAEPPNPETLKKSFLGPVNVELACYLAGLLIIAVAMLIVMNAEIIPDGFVGGLGILVFIGLVTYTFLTMKGTERNRMFAAIYFVLAQIPFWALFEQAGSSLNLFTDRLVDKTMFGVEVPAPVFQALNAGYIVIFAPILAWLWIALAKRKLEPSTPVKFAVGVFLAGLGFLSLVGGIGASGSTGLTAVYFIFLIYWVHTMGELMVSPVGLSAVTKMAPARVVGMTMGAWFLYSGLSNYLAGIIARGTGAETIGGQITDVAAAKATYASVYSSVGYIAMAIGIVMLLISPVIKSWMKGDHLPDESPMVSDEMT